MAFDILSILNGATLAETERTEEYQDIVLDYRDIVVTKHNKYSMVEIQELATGILMTGGIQEPLVGLRGILAPVGTPEVCRIRRTDSGRAYGM